MRGILVSDPEVSSSGKQCSITAAGSTRPITKLESACSVSLGKRGDRTPKGPS